MNQREDDATKIALHHVGARSGATSFFDLPNFSEDFTRVMYEADVDAIDDLSTRTIPGDVVLPYCLGGYDGVTTLHLTYCPCMSSLYPVTDRSELTEVMNGFDYRISRAGRAVESRPVKQYRLDSLAELRDGSVPPPTILSMDTQGSEHDIIQGGLETIREHTLAIQTEVEFTEYYSGQALFGDIAKTLDDLGFVFAGLLRQQHMLLSRQPLGFRGSGLLTSGDALFLRKINTVSGKPLHLIKLGLIALSLGYLDYAFEAWLKVPRNVLDSDALATRKYTRLIRDLLTAYDETPQVYPKEFEDFYSLEASRARFEPTQKAMVAESIEAARQRIRQTILATDQNALVALSSADDLPLEATLRRYGLNELAENAKSRRTLDIERFLAAAGLQKGNNPGTLTVAAGNGWPRYRLPDNVAWPGN